MKNIITIIGGGASGTAAAIFAARLGAEAIIIERKDRILKKLLQTGNGRCNFSNLSMDKSHFYGENSDFAEYALSVFGPSEAIEFFRSAGVETTEENRRLYPKSNRASTVSDMFRLELERLGVKILTDSTCKKIDASNGKIIYAAGGNSSLPQGECVRHEVVESLGHKIVPLAPGLVQLRSGDKFIKGLSGQRAFVRVTALSGRDELCTELGELLFTDYGVSGIAVMSLSTRMARKDNLSLKVNFLPEYSESEAKVFLNTRFSEFGHLDMENFLNGITGKRIGAAIAKLSGISTLSRKAETLTEPEKDAVLANLCGLIIEITGGAGFKCSQVTLGGVATDEVNEFTMESKLIPGLYFCGEALDIAGDCGGYNLHWAWASAYLAARAACGGSYCNAKFNRGINND